MTNKQKIKLLEAEIQDLSKQLVWESSKRLEASLAIRRMEEEIQCLRHTMCERYELADGESNERR